MSVKSITFADSKKQTIPDSNLIISIFLQTTFYVQTKIQQHAGTALQAFHAP